MDCCITLCLELVGPFALSLAALAPMYLLYILRDSIIHARLIPESAKKRRIGAVKERVGGLG